MCGDLGRAWTSGVPIDNRVASRTNPAAPCCQSGVSLPSRVCYLPSRVKQSSTILDPRAHLLSPDRATPNCRVWSRFVHLIRGEVECSKMTIKRNRRAWQPHSADSALQRAQPRLHGVGGAVGGCRLDRRRIAIVKTTAATIAPVNATVGRRRSVVGVPPPPRGNTAPIGTSAASPTPTTANWLRLCEPVDTETATRYLPLAGRNLGSA